MTRQTTFGFALSLAVAAAAVVYTLNTGSARAQSGSAKKASTHVVYTDDNGVAMNGYDPVAYFTASRPTRGTAEFSTDWHGATWRFASAENLAAFQQDPERYAPAYGGYCAWGVGAQNDLFPIDPNAWRIVDGTLYLNYNADVQQKWLADIPGFIRSADANWPGLVRKNAN